MTRMTLADFEARYAAQGDPWGYTESEYEQRKYAATLAACGPGPFACALELGGSIGVFSAQLASALSPLGHRRRRANRRGGGAQAPGRRASCRRHAGRDPHGYPGPQL